VKTLRPILLLALLIAPAGRAAAGEPALDRYAVVEVAPVSTFIYLASVRLDVPRFVRTGGTYASTYAAHIIPYYFWDEHGRLEIEVSDAALLQFSRGAPFSFTGHAIRSDGVRRRIAGRVTPGDAANGKITVRLYVSRHLSLNFETTYH
jgi:hypothetical protein